MVGWHTVIGIGEALITGLVVGSVVAVRPDLVYGARPAAAAAATLEIRTDGGGVHERRRTLPRSAGSSLVALLLAGVVSFYASGHPDGLEYVAEKTGFLDTADDHADRRRPVRRLRHQGRRRRPAGRGRRRRRRRLLVLVLAGGLGYAVRRRGPPRRARPRADRGLRPDGRRARPPAALPRALARPPRPGAPEDPGAARRSCCIVVATPRDWYAAYAVYLARAGRRHRASSRVPPTLPR